MSETGGNLSPYEIRMVNRMTMRLVGRVTKVVIGEGQIWSDKVGSYDSPSFKSCIEF